MHIRETATGPYEPYPDPASLTPAIVYNRLALEAEAYAQNDALHIKAGIAQPELRQLRLSGPHTWLGLDESVQPGNNFKFNGAVNAVDAVSQAYPEGVSLLVPSAGNWALAVTIAASNYGLPVEVYCPKTVSEAKRDLLLQQGQELGVPLQVVDHFESVDTARKAAHRDAKRDHDAEVLDPFDNLYGVAGQMLAARRAVTGVTALLERGELDPDSKVLFLAQVGGGSLATATAIQVDIARESGELKGLDVSVFGVRPEPTVPHPEFYDGLHVPHIGNLAGNILNISRLVQGRIDITDGHTGRAADAVYREFGKKAEPAGLAGVAGMLAAADVCDRPTTFVTYISGANVTADRYTYFKEAPARAQRGLLGLEGQLAQRSRQTAGDLEPGLLSSPTAWYRDPALRPV